MDIQDNDEEKRVSRKKSSHEMGPNWAYVKAQVEEGWRSILERVAATLGEPYIKDLYVEQSIAIRATPEKVWQVLTDSRLSREWIQTWWPDVTLISDWRLGSPVVWETANGSVGAQGDC